MRALFSLVSLTLLSLSSVSFADQEMLTRASRLYDILDTQLAVFEQNHALNLEIKDPVFKTLVIEMREAEELANRLEWYFGDKGRFINEQYRATAIESWWNATTMSSDFSRLADINKDLLIKILPNLPEHSVLERNERIVKNLRVAYYRLDQAVKSYLEFQQHLAMEDDSVNSKLRETVQQTSAKIAEKGYSGESELNFPPQENVSFAAGYAKMEGVIYAQIKLFNKLAEQKRKPTATQLRNLIYALGTSNRMASKNESVISQNNDVVRRMYPHAAMSDQSGSISVRFRNIEDRQTDLLHIYLPRIDELEAPKFVDYILGQLKSIYFLTNNTLGFFLVHAERRKTNEGLFWDPKDVVAVQATFEKSAKRITDATYGTAGDRQVDYLSQNTFGSIHYEDSVNSPLKGADALRNERDLVTRLRLDFYRAVNSMMTDRFGRRVDCNRELVVKAAVQKAAGQ